MPYRQKQSSGAHFYANFCHLSIYVFDFATKRVTRTCKSSSET